MRYARKLRLAKGILVLRCGAQTRFLGKPRHCHKNFKEEKDGRVDHENLRKWWESRPVRCWRLRLMAGCAANKMSEAAQAAATQAIRCFARRSRRASRRRASGGFRAGVCQPRLSSRPQMRSRGGSPEAMRRRLRPGGGGRCASSNRHWHHHRHHALRRLRRVPLLKRVPFRLKRPAATWRNWCDRGLLEQPVRPARLVSPAPAPARV